MFDLEQSIAAWRRQMLAGGLKSQAVLEELESHLREDVEQQTRLGRTSEQAFGIAIKRLGPVCTLKPEFEKTAQPKLLRFRENLLRAFGIAFCSFLFGACLGYFAILPLALRASREYYAWLGLGSHEWVATGQFSFVCRFAIGVGVGFAIPVGLLVLLKTRLLDYQKLVRLRPYCLIVNLILGALLATPEVITQIMMFISLQLLCEASVWIAKYGDRKGRYV